jgi:S1-C subfamily serine protease
MLRKTSVAALGLLTAQLGLSDAHAQRAATPRGTTPPISRVETRPNIGAGRAYGSAQDRSVRSATSTDAGVGSTATGSRIGARTGSRVGFGATFDDGVINDLIVDRVTAGSPAAIAGLRSGDTIVSINDRRFRNQQQASSFLRGFQGDHLNMTVLRDGALVDVTANTAVNANAAAQVNAPSTVRHDFGINDALGFGVRLGATDNGIVVREVARNSLASDTGIRAGDRIVSLGGRNVNDTAAVNQVLSGIGRDPTLDVVVARDGRPVDLTANLARYTGYYSTVDHSRGGTVDAISGTERFGSANVEGFQSVLGATFARDQNGNMIVSRIAPNSPAADFGLQRGDVLFGSNGRPITNSQGLMQFFSSARPGAEFGVNVWREGQQMNLAGTFDQAYFNELNALSEDDGQIEEKRGSGANRPASRTAMRGGVAGQPGTSRFDDGAGNDQFDRPTRPGAFQDNRTTDGFRQDGLRANESANPDLRQFPRSPSSNPYRRPGQLGNPGNDQQDGSIRDRPLNQGQPNQGQLNQGQIEEKRQNQGGVFDDSNTSRSFRNGNQQNGSLRSRPNRQSTRIDTPEAQDQLNAVEDLRESFLRGQTEGQSQDAGANGQRRPGSLGNGPRTGGNRSTGIMPQGRGTGVRQGAQGQVQGGVQGGIQAGASSGGGNRGGGTGGAVRGGATGGGAAGAGGGRR